MDYGSLNGPRALIGKAFRQVRAASTPPLTPTGQALQQPSSAQQPSAAPRNLRYVVVTIEYFTKWIEAKPLATITSQVVKNSFGNKSYVTSEY